MTRLAACLLLVACQSPEHEAEVIADATLHAYFEGYKDGKASCPRVHVEDMIYELPEAEDHRRDY